jgi:hypothetical protein
MGHGTVQEGSIEPVRKRVTKHLAFLKQSGFSKAASAGSFDVHNVAGF